MKRDAESAVRELELVAEVKVRIEQETPSVRRSGAIAKRLVLTFLLKINFHMKYNPCSSCSAQTVGHNVVKTLGLAIATKRAAERQPEG